MANKQTTGERLVAVETNLKNLNERVDTGFTEIKGSIKELSTQINVLVPTLVTQAQMSEKVSDLQKELSSMKLELTNAKRKSSLQTWLTSTMSAIVAVILTILIQAYFNK